MLKILGYLRNAKATVFLIIALLVAQAVCDLKLPQYTADIVDVGLNQSGIEDIAPKEMTPQTFETLSLFMTDEEIQTVRDAYETNEAGNLTRRISGDALGEAMSESMAALAQFVLALKGLQGAIQEAAAQGTLPEETAQTATLARLVQSDSLKDYLHGMAGNAVALLKDSGLLDGRFGLIPASRLADMGEGTGQMDAPRFSEMVQMGLLNRETLQSFRRLAIGRMGEMRDTMVRMSAIQLIKREYETVGIDVNKIQTNYLLLTGAKMLGVTLAAVIAAVLAGLLAARTAAKVAMSLRGKLFAKVMAFSTGDVDKFSTASLITRSTNDIQHVQMATVMILRIVIYAPILGIGGIIKVATTHTGLSWIIVVAVAFLLLLVTVLMTIAMPKFRLVQTQLDDINLVAREVLTGLKVIRAFSREKRENERFDEVNTALVKTQLFTNRLMSIMMPIMTLIVNGIMIAVVWFGGQRIDMGTLQVGGMMAFITYTMQIVISFLMLSMISVFLPRAFVSANRIEEVLRTQASILDKENVLDDTKECWEGTVAFESVDFRYPDAEANILEGITFTAKAGRTTAIIGSTGSGKSTLLNLIPRFFDVTGGRITLDGVDIRDLSQHKLRSLLGYVPQKGVLFFGDIESNIKYGGEDITDAMMREAAEVAQAADFIEEKPEKYHDPIAQGGNNVSGGQKQRLSIARAIAKRPKVLLFDDSFSALDYKTDVTLRRALHTRVQGVTNIIVAQRINTVLHADQIVVLEEGRMAGIGTHRELMRTCETYQEIARSQLSEAELEEGGVFA
ncbi:MAG: ABC transporter ATP-binding protein/permease [Firmicutes bacterium]|nr:ABC transporter ATP-binding protein/permease [Bacillota bacterium]